MLKDPDAKLPFTVDWSRWLEAEDDTIVSVEWLVPEGITKLATPPPTLSEGRATVWLGGGTHKSLYNVVCRITTEAGRVDERTLVIHIHEQ